MKNITNCEFDHATANDEAIARAIAESENNSSTFASSDIGYPATSSSTPSSNGYPASRRNQRNQADCPQYHGLELFQTPPAQRVTCNGCQKTLRGGEQVWSCVRCNLDACENCYRRGVSLRSSDRDSFGQNNPYATTTTTTTTTTSSRSQSAASRSPDSNTFTPPFTNPPHMCMIPCLIGNVTVEMLVDTGAQTSVLSMPLVRQLGLTNRLDRRYMGVAAGVGRAKIVGSVRNVVCAFGNGHVEFLMDFMVLDISDPLVLLGLDQMRKYRCITDLEKDVLIFGGSGGLEVPMLPAEQQHLDVRSLGGCTVM